MVAGLPPAGRSLGTFGPLSAPISNVTLNRMTQFDATMPELRYRSTKRKVEPPSSIPGEQLGSAAASSISAEGNVEKPAKRKVAKKRKRSEVIASWWPVGVGLFFTGFVPEWQAIAEQAGIWALRATFPLTLLAGHSQNLFAGQISVSLPQAALFLQLPLEGLLVKLTIDSGRGLRAGLWVLFVLHVLAVFALWLLSYLAR